MKIFNTKGLKQGRSALAVLALVFLSANCMAQFPKVLIPKDAVVQHAGSIGYFSVGAGYHLFKNKRGNLDFNYGYVPESKGGSLHIMSAKFAYRPWDIKLKEWGHVYPFNPGAFVSYHLGKQFDFHWDKEQYADGYYWWSSALRPHISVSSEIKVDADRVLRTQKIKTLSFYTEVNTNELYMVSYLQNLGGLDITKIMMLGFGVRVGF